MEMTVIDPMEVERKLNEEIDEVPVWRYGHVDAVSMHITDTDYLLRAVVDVAQVTHDLTLEHSEEEPLDNVAVMERMETILELLKQYRKQNWDFVHDIDKKALAAGKAS